MFYGPDGIPESSLELKGLRTYVLRMFKSQMAPTGFEPATPGLKVQYSNRAELRGRIVGN